MLKRSSSADEIIINALSIMWQLPMTIIFTEDLRQLKIKHTKKNLKEVEIVLLHAKGMHYLVAGKGHNYILWVTTTVQEGCNQGVRVITTVQLNVKCAGCSYSLYRS